MSELGPLSGAKQTSNRERPDLPLKRSNDYPGVAAADD
jgi:hypothetical protein